MIITNNEIKALEETTGLGFSSICLDVDKTTLTFINEELVLELIYSPNYQYNFTCYVNSGSFYEKAFMYDDDNFNIVGDVTKSFLSLANENEQIKEHLTDYYKNKKLYKHHSGEIYRLNAIGNKTATKYDEIVSYTKLRSNELFMRNKSEFDSKFNLITV